MYEDIEELEAPFSSSILQLLTCRHVHCQTLRDKHGHYNKSFETHFKSKPINLFQNSVPPNQPTQPTQTTSTTLPSQRSITTRQTNPTRRKNPRFIRSPLLLLRICHTRKQNFHFISRFERKKEKKKFVLLSWPSGGRPCSSRLCALIFFHFSMPSTISRSLVDISLLVEGCWVHTPSWSWDWEVIF